MIVEVRKTYITDKVNYLKRQLDYHPGAIIQHKTKILHYYYLIQSNLYKECTKFDELSIIYNDVYFLTQQCNILLQDDIIQSILDFLNELSNLRITDPKTYEFLCIPSDFPLSACKADLFKLSPQQLDKLLTQMDDLKSQMDNAKKKYEMVVKKKEETFKQVKDEFQELQELYNKYHEYVGEKLNHQVYDFLQNIPTTKENLTTKDLSDLLFLCHQHKSDYSGALREYFNTKIDNLRTNNTDMLKRYPKVLRPYSNDILSYRKGDSSVDFLYSTFKELLSLNNKLILLVVDYLLDKIHIAVYIYIYLFIIIIEIL